MIVESDNLHQYKLFIELLRDTKVYSEPYFDIKDIIVGQENAFQEFDNLIQNTDEY